MFIWTSTTEAQRQSKITVQSGREIYRATIKSRLKKDTVKTRFRSEYSLILITPITNETCF